MIEPTLVHRRRAGSARWLRLAPLLVSVVGLAAQTQPTFHIEANYVRVDVYATRSGVPVTDLSRDDFEVFEGDVPQTIAEFTRIAVGQGPRADTPRREVRTLDESRQAIGEAPARVFVLFLDPPHVDRSATLRIRKPLTEALDRLVGPDDLVAVMTPDVNVRDLTFVRRPSSVDQLLGQLWGTRDEVNFTDPVERRYASCYPGLSTAANSDRGIAQEMILRRREQRTLDALEELVLYLRGVREERKAVITISNGWRLFTPNAALARPIDGVVPSGPPVTIDPRNGRLTTSGSPAYSEATVCEGDRQSLAQLDQPPRFRQMLDEANRANVSFYPVDPRGLVTFDEDIVPAAGVGVLSNNPTIPVDQDLRRLNERHDSLRLMADVTDGLAIVENSNLAAGLRRVSDDLSTYYLLGYYSTGRLDGKFHAIKVRAKRPGVQLRARRGYLAATAAAAASVDPGRTTTSGVTSVASMALASALETLGTTAGEPTLRARAASAYTPAGAVAVSVVADGARGSGGGNEWAGGGDADVMVMDATGTTVASAHVQIAPGSISLRVVLTSAALPPGEYDVRLREKGTGSASPSTVSTKLTIAAAPAGTGSILFRRGPTTGNRELPTTDLRFRRTERLRVDAPSTGATAAARLLDRLGKPLPIPVGATVFVDADGTGWMTAQLALAPLAVGDYVIELIPDGDESRRRLSAFRLVP